MLRFKETQDRNRATLFDEAMRRAQESGKAWNDMPGVERDALVQEVEQEWAEEDSE